MKRRLDFQGASLGRLAVPKQPGREIDDRSGEGLWLRAARQLPQSAKFCMVGGSGVVVDMAVLHLLVASGWCGWFPAFAKVISAESALLNNFLWNEVWTFRAEGRQDRTVAGVMGRLWRFHAICGVGIGWAVLFLQLFHAWAGLDLYLANLVAIGFATVWNFWLNARLNWGARRRRARKRGVDLVRCI